MAIITGSQITSSPAASDWFTPAGTGFTVACSEGYVQLMWRSSSSATESLLAGAVGPGEVREVVRNTAASQYRFVPQGMPASAFASE